MRVVDRPVPPQTRPRIRLGPADKVTLVRAVLTAGVAGYALAAVVTREAFPAAALLAAVALPLDAVDGWVARRTGTSSARGARFDMEVDAALILALSVLLVGPMGAWVLVGGLMRYVYWLAGSALPWLTRPLPARRSRKVVAAAQGIVLAVAVGGVLPGPVAAGAVGVAFATLAWSFGRDVAWLAAANVERNRSRNASIGHTGTRDAGRSPALHPQPAALVSTARSRATIVTGTSRLAP
ncbi:MAG TPA: CDP-alcohol phosphatidyltransferase family protein [Kineosporiaceae bacterium]|nr:CDP-alcohol phosphatidyltransferase family protein [Kineosporiaceae bacterium]